MSGERLLTWRSGGGILLFALLATVAAVAVLIVRSRQRLEEQVGDGVHPASYGFDLSTATVPRDRIHASGFPRDEHEALTDPETIDVAGLEAYTGRHKLVVTADRVVGVARAGEARAYPLRLLAVHGVVNDTLGGEPIAVSYDVHGDAAAVVSRADGEEVREFGWSGLVHGGVALLYDRREDGLSSLWSPLAGRAIAGPAAVRGERLRILPSSLVPWGDWRTRHPGTTILAPAAGFETRYKEMTYGIDRERGDLTVPVEDYPPPGPVDPWARVVALLGEDGPRVRVVGPAGYLAPEPGIPCVHAYWYAYHAARPDGGAPEEE